MENRFSILIVDDDECEIEVLSDILTSTYDVHSVCSSEHALQLAIEKKPDLILLDILMPCMTGFEVLKQLKCNIQTKHIPVIFITGLDEVENEEMGFALGAVDYIRKPFHASVVKARINAHIKGPATCSDDAYFVVKTRKNIRNILFRELVYVEKFAHFVNFHLANDEKVSVYATLKEYEPILLKEGRLAHCHKSFIVNMDYVTQVNIRDLLLKNDIQLPISRGFFDFKKRYLNWLCKNGAN